MEFDNRDEIEFQYKKNRTCRCEECGYVWVEEITVESNDPFNVDQGRGDFCPMCGGSYLDQI